MAHGMPRLDLRRATGEPAAYRSGFWGLARIGRRTGPVVLGLRARLEGGDVREEALARIAVATPPAPLAGTPKVAICMATFEPPIELFRAQVESIRAQTETDWLCVVADDCSAPARLEEMRAVLGDDPRFVLMRVRSEARVLWQLRARAGAGAGRRAVRRARRPGRRLAPRQARDAARRARRRASRLQRPAGRRAGRLGRGGQLLGAPRQQPHQPAVAAGRERGDGRRVAVPPFAARRRPSVPAGPVRPLPRSLARADRSLRSATSATSTARSTTTSSTAPRRSGTPTPPRLRACARGWPAAAARASGSGCGGCTTSSTSAG